MSRFGEAGKRDAGTRSDCWIGVELKDAGGITISLQSKVAAYYGEAISTQLQAGCSALGVTHAAVTVVDAGALPYVLAARLETAVRRAGHVPDVYKRQVLIWCFSRRPPGAGRSRSPCGWKHGVRGADIASDIASESSVAGAPAWASPRAAARGAAGHGLPVPAARDGLWR